MSKILLVTNAFYPENSPRSFRATELAKEFSRQRHIVTVITHKNKQQETLLNYYNLEVKDLGALRYAPIKLSGSGIKLLIQRAIARLARLFFEYPNIQLMNMVANSLKKEKGYDLLISIAVPYPIHWGVARVYKKRGILAKKWVADCGDPYMGDRTDSFRKPFYFKYVEKWFSRRADYLSVPIEEAINAYYKEFHHKIKVIPQGIKFEDFKIASENYKSNEVISFCYAGSFIKDNRDPRPFIEFLLSLANDFKFYIFTNKEVLIGDQVRRSKGRIIVRKYIPREELINIMAKMDFLVNIENNTAVQAPSKLIDYYLSRRPVLSVPHNILNKEQILEFLGGDFSQRMIMHDYEKYRIENVVSAFLKTASLQKPL